jgi:hypothetical protein
MPDSSPAFISPDAQPALIDELDFLTQHCPKGRHRATCPFKMLSGVSRAHRIFLLMQMDLGQIHSLFDLAGDCLCPADPRGKGPYLPRATAP